VSEYKSSTDAVAIAVAHYLAAPYFKGPEKWCVVLTALGAHGGSDNPWAGDLYRHGLDDDDEGEHGLGYIGNRLDFRAPGLRAEVEAEYAARPTP
jgi:hypothetical protein